MARAQHTMVIPENEPGPQAMLDYRVTIYNEFVHEQENPEVRSVYPDGIHGAIGASLRDEPGFTVHRIAQCRNVWRTI